MRDYRAGKSPFLRGTFHMIGLASEVIGSDPRTKGVVILQMTWSAGDHLVARAHLKTVADLKGKTIVLQQGGPHVGMLGRRPAIRQAHLERHQGGLGEGPDGLGRFPAGTVPQAGEHRCLLRDHARHGRAVRRAAAAPAPAPKAPSRARASLVSTAELSRSIADVYVCRKDFYDANKALVTKFVAGYLKACEEIIDLKKQYETAGSPPYKKLLQLTQDIYGKTTIPTLEDAHGLLSDCTFVGYPGNVAFFTQEGNLHGFEAFQKSALDLAISRGYARERMGLFPSGLDYQSPAFLSYLTKTEAGARRTVPGRGGAERDRSPERRRRAG